MRHAIEIEGLSKRFGPRAVLERFELFVEPGETLAILGASGCGKSTLLRCIAGLVRPDAGTIAVRDELGFVFQEPRLLPWLTVERNVAFAARSDVGDVSSRCHRGVEDPGSIEVHPEAVTPGRL